MHPSSAIALPLQWRPGAPALLQADTAGDTRGWVAAHRDALRHAVVEHGAVMVRGLGLRDHGGVAETFHALSATGLMAEREAFAPREAHQGGVYSSTKWPANQQMCMHHELSYTLEFPGIMMFACLTPPGSGGATAVADAAAVLEALPTDLVARFEDQGWLLTRTYNEEIGAGVEDAFGTEDRAAVEAYCRDNAIEHRWEADGGLSTRQRRHAVLGHPTTGVGCWFNQIAFLNEWTLDPDVREFLVETYGPDGLPFTTRWGNGEPIGPDVVQTINGVYERHTLREPWQAGDVLLVDNVRMAHSREPYEGPREVLVGLADALRMPAPEGMA